MPKCLHRNSIAVDIDGAGENFRFCNDCGENFQLSSAPLPAATTHDIERQILMLVEGSIEDTRVSDAIAAHADKRAGKPVTKTDADQLEAQLGIPVRIRRQFGMTHVAWTVDVGGKRDERSILLAHSDTNVRWPTGDELRTKEPAYFGARDDRNAARRRLLQEHATLRGAIGSEIPDADDESAIYRAACAIAKLREARAALEDLIEYGQPLHVVRFAIEKLSGKE